MSLTNVKHIFVQSTFTIITIIVTDIGLSIADNELAILLFFFNSEKNKQIFHNI